MGWFQSAGDWVSDKTDAVLSGVGDTLDGASEFASDAWDVVTSSDFSWKDGAVAIETDLGEVMDLLPEGAREAFALAEGQDNRVTVEVDTKTRELRVKSADLKFAGISQGGLTTGAVTLEGVVMTISNHGGGIPFLDGDFSLFGYEDADDQVAIHISAARVVGSDVAFESTEGPIHAESVALEGFSLDAAGEGGMPFGEKGNTAASFSIGTSVLRGVSHESGRVDEVSAAGLGGGLTGQSETAYLAADALGVEGLATADGSLSAGGLTDIRADIRNEGGGLPLFDATPDSLKANVTAGAATFSDGVLAGGTLASGRISDMELYAEQETGLLEAAAGELTATDIASGSGGAERIQGTDLTFRYSGGEQRDLDATLGSLQASGVSAEGGEATRVHVTGASASRRGDAWDGAVATAGVADATFGKLAVDEASVSGVSAWGGSGQEAGAEVSTVDVKGFGSGEDVAVAYAGARDARFVKGEGGLESSAASLSLRDAVVGDVRVGSAHASSATSMMTEGGSQLAAESIGIEDLTAHRLAVGSLSAQGATASLQEGHHTAAFASGTARDLLLADRLAVAQAEVEGVSASVAGSERRTAVAAARASGVSDRQTGARLTGGQVSGLTHVKDGDTSRTSLDEASGTGLSLGDARAEAVSVSGVAVNKAGEQVDGSVRRAGLEQVRVGDTLTAESIAAGDLAGRVGPSGPSGTAGFVEGREIGFQASGGGASGGMGTVDTSSLVRTLGQRVDDASVQVGLPMNAGSYSTGVGLTVKEGTSLSAGLNIKDGEISALNADFTRPVSGPLWTNVKGLYTEEDRVKARVGGFFDQNLTKGVNKGLGLGGKDLHSVAAYSDAVATQLGSSSSSGQSDKPGIGEAFDPSRMELDGSVSLSAGLVDAGVASAVLQDGEGANTVEVSSSPGAELTMALGRFLASSLSVDVGGKQIDTATASLEGARLTVDNGGSGSATGSVGAVRVEDVRLGQGR